MRGGKRVACDLRVVLVVVVVVVVVVVDVARGPTSM